VICYLCGYDHGGNDCPKSAIVFRTAYAEEINETTKIIEEAIVARDRWWIEQMEILMKETTLRPLDITYSNYLIVRWEQFKKTLERRIK